MTRQRHQIVGLVTRNERGQSLMLALMVLFIVCFIGGLFVTLVATNLGRTRRSGQTMTADYLAEAGVRYASDQLSYSLDGADWRPVPEHPSYVAWLYTPQPKSPLPQQGVVEPWPGDPDYVWLAQGFCRYNYGDGRFLLRVTYDPRLGDPTTKQIKIECIGRSGRYSAEDVNDPTISMFRQPIRLRAERLAYKAMAITDYSRFITNKERRSEPFTLGVPPYTQPDGVIRPFVTQYGMLGDTNGDGVAHEPYGGSIRVNGNLMWSGTNYLWLDRTRNENVEVAGYITHAAEWNRTGAAPPPDSTAVYVNPPKWATGTGWIKDNLARQSTDPFFDTSPDYNDTDVGIYRDGYEGGDIGRVAPGGPYPRARSIQRLEPPLLDVTGPAGGLGRYRELTRNSGDWIKTDASTGAAAWFNTGYYGWGAGLYINNRDDVQAESELRTLRDDWLNPGGSQYWAGPYYTPPGVIIVLTPYDLDGRATPKDPHQDMILMQNNVSGAKYEWHDKAGNVLTPSGGRMIMAYPANGIIFAEGNVRIQGVVPNGVHLTVVSGATIYVDGNILKQSRGLGPGGAVIPEASRNSAVSLLATDYVCVNTTQFFGPAYESQTPANWRPDMSGYAASVERPLAFSFSFGEDAAVKYENESIPICAYVRHTADSGDNAAYMNMTVNQSGPGVESATSTNLVYGLYRFWKEYWPVDPNRPSPAIPDKRYIYPLADQDAFFINAGSPVTPLFVSCVPALTAAEFSAAAAEQKWPIWEHRVYTLDPLPDPNTYSFLVSPGATNTIGFNLDPSLARADYLLSRFAVEPCDIRIEALMYAESGSFFVIPGEWFNPDAGDTIENFRMPEEGLVAPDGRRAVERRRIDDRWPFYGQPLDVEVTVYGAVSEDVPAPIGDRVAWMEKWGWIPPIHGSSAEDEDQTVVWRVPLDPTDTAGQVLSGGGPVRQRGFKIVYDYKLSYPKVPDNNTDPTDRNYDLPMRRDSLMRPLPITPKLPVSPQLVYFGEPA